MTADQFFSALWRRRKLVALVAGIVFVLGAAAVIMMPSIYESNVVMRVETHRPSDDMVRRTVNESIISRLATVRQELLARPVLQRVIEEQKLYSSIIAKRGMDSAVEAMRKDIDVKMEGEAAFSVTYRARDPQTAQKVAARLPQVFVEEAVKLRQGQAQRATALFTGEIERLKAAVSEWEKKISEFKIAHMGELPEQLEMNMRGLERLSAMMQTKSEELRVAESRRSDMARMNLSADSEAGRLEAAETALSRELVAARTQWTEDHPEVQRLDREVANLTTRRKQAEGRMVAEKEERARSIAMVGGITGDMENIKKQAELFQSRLDRTPQWAHELGVLQRDYEVAREKYQSVISRRVEAEIAQELESKGAADMFQIISPANLPTGPAKPDRLSGLLITALLAMGAGVLAGTVTDLRDDSVREPNQLQQRIPVPVLAVVPLIGGHQERRVLSAGYERNEMDHASMN